MRLAWASHDTLPQARHCQLSHTRLLFNLRKLPLELVQAGIDRPDLVLGPHSVRPQGLLRQGGSG